MSSKPSPDLIKQHAIDNFSLYIDECIGEFKFKSDMGFSITIEDVEEIWGTLLERNSKNISEIISSLVSYSDGEDLIREVKKKIREASWL